MERHITLEFTDEDIQRKPWKFIGYKGYSRFLASDRDFYILRCFDELNVRVALSLQDGIAELEERLDKLDKEHSGRESEDVNNGSLRNDLPERAKLMHTIAKRLRQYNEFLLQQHNMKRLSKAPCHDIKSIKNWHYNHDYAAIALDEQKYLEKDDLVRVFQSEKTPLRQVIDSSLRLRTLPIWRSRHGEADHHDRDLVSYYSDKRIDGFASIIITFIGVTMLIAPIWILQAQNALAMKLAVITVFVSTFLVLVSFAMASKPFEALGATAAYAAVLMVFIQFGNANT